jgi:hypothetical protein
MSGCGVNCPGLAVADGKATRESSHYVRSPYVAVSFSGDPKSKPFVTIGNESAPGLGNSAVIKSFEFGASNGLQATVEIVDVSGGAFEKFVKSIRMDTKDSTDPVTHMNVVWGWILSDCDSPSVAKFETTDPISLLVTHIDTTFTNGIIRFTVTGNDVAQGIFGSRGEKVIGSDKHPVPLKEALNKLFTEIKDAGPLLEPVGKAKVVFADSKGNDSGWEFKKGKGKPLNYWQYGNQNKISTAMRWISTETTQNDRGICMYIDSKTGNLVLQEAPNPCVGDLEPISPAKTYIVNGGSCSSVISFTPTINWLAPIATQMANGGGGGGTVSPITPQQSLSAMLQKSH